MDERDCTITLGYIIVLDNQTHFEKGFQNQPHFEQSQVQINPILWYLFDIFVICQKRVVTNVTTTLRVFEEVRYRAP